MVFTTLLMAIIYKMCLHVYANGHGTSKYMYTPLYFSTQGEFDNQLEWPFRGTITYKLVNQEDDRDHVIKTVDYTDILKVYLKHIAREWRNRSGHVLDGGCNNNHFSP